MSSNVQALAQMADHAATQITASHTDWTDFLKPSRGFISIRITTMIFAQRPDGTACAGYEVWNEKMRRYIRRGGKPRIRYVFDISDTGGRENSRRPYFWQDRPEHEDTVAAALEQEYAVSRKVLPISWNRSPGKWQRNIGRIISTTSSTSLTAAFRGTYF